MNPLNGTRMPALTVVLAATAMAWAGPLRAQERTESVEQGAGREHVVRKGDTLWDLARAYLSNPFLWPTIYDVNRGIVEDPHWIYPDERLLIPPGGAVAAADAAATPGAVFAAAADDAAGAGVVQRTRFYQPAHRPGSSQASETFLAGEAIEVLSVEPGEYLAAPWLDDPGQLPVLGELIQLVGRREIDKLSQAVHPFDQVYVRYARGERPAVGDRLLMVERGRSFGGYGRVIVPAAVVTVTELGEDVFVGIVSDQYGPLGPGSLAIPYDPFPGAAPAPARPVEGGPVAELLGFVIEQPLYDLADRGFINLGRGDGIELGDELIAFLPERAAGGLFSERLPPLTVARLRVIRVGERSSTVRVLDITYPTLDAGMPVQVIAKMP